MKVWGIRGVDVSPYHRRVDEAIEPRDPGAMKKSRDIMKDVSRIQVDLAMNSWSILGTVHIEYGIQIDPDMVMHRKTLGRGRCEHMGISY